MGCASGSGGKTVDDKVGEGNDREARESLHQPGRRLRGCKEKETGWKNRDRTEEEGRERLRWERR